VLVAGRSSTGSLSFAGAKSDGPAVGSSADGSSTTLSTGVGSDVSSGASGRSVRHNFSGIIDCGDFARDREQGVGTMPETARPTRINAEGVPRQSRLPAFVVLLAFVVGLAANLEVSSCSMLVRGPIASTAHAQPAGSSRLQLRAKIKSAAEKLNDIASAGPDMTRAMFAGKTSSTSVLALNEKSIAAQDELESAVLAAGQGGALSADESKELARLGELAKKTREPVKEDIKTLKSTLNLPIVGGDAAVRLAPKSQQDAAINNVEASKRAVGALVAAIRKLP
jgi:hypothetical protein